MSRRKRWPGPVRHLAELALSLAGTSPLPLPAPTPGGQVQLHLPRFPLRRRHPDPEPNEHHAILLGERFYRGGLTLRGACLRATWCTDRSFEAQRLYLGGGEIPRSRAAMPACTRPP